MARLWSSGFELNSTTAGVEWSDFTNGSIVTSPVRTGTYSSSVINSASTTRRGSTQQFASSAGAGPYYFRFYLYATTLPNANTSIFAAGTATNITGWATTDTFIRLSSASKLVLLSNNVTVGTGGTTLVTGQWYRVELSFDNTGGAGAAALTLKLDGNTEVTSTTATAPNISSFGIGKADTSSVTCDLSFDDVALNDSTGSFQTGLPGDAKIIHLRPSAAGDNTAWTIAGSSPAATNWQSVSEVTPDDAVTTVTSKTSGEIDDYNIDNTPAGLDSSATINVVSVGYRFNRAGASSASYVLRIKSSSGGTVEESAAVTPASSTYLTNEVSVPRNYHLTLYDLPGASTTAWTKSTLDTAQIGQRTTVTNTNVNNISAIWALVEYVPSAGTTVTPDAIASTTTFYSPTITTGGVTVTPDAVAAATTLHSPTVSPGAVTVTPDALAATTQIYQPTVTTTATIAPSAIAATTTIYAPTVSFGYTITSDHLASTTTFYMPVITTGSVTVTPNHLASSTTIYLPSLDTVVPYRLIARSHQRRGSKTYGRTHSRRGAKTTTRGPRTYR